MVIEGKHKEVTLTRAIFAGITGTSPLANPITRMFALQFRSFIESFVSFPPTGSYRTSTPLSFLSLRKAFTFSMTFWWFKSTTWSTPKDRRYSTFLAPLKDNARNRSHYMLYHNLVWVGERGPGNNRRNFGQSWWLIYEILVYLATAITTAPQTLPIWTAARPTPPAAPRTNSTYKFSFYNHELLRYQCLKMILHPQV